MPSELANTSLATAFNMGNMSGNITWNWNSAIDGVDPNQYYRFNLSNSSSFNLSMSGLQANANLDLLNNSGGLIASSTNSGILAESLSRQLTAGTYYIRVSSIGGANTSYKLGLQGSGAGVDPGSNISSALDFGSFTTNTSRSWGESVSTSDTLDLYRVNLVQYSNLSLSLNNLSANADLQLLDSAGALLASSTNTGTASESLVRALNAGTYFVRVNSVNSNTSYTLSTATSFINAAPTSLQFNLNKTSFSNAETLTISSGQVWDNNGTTDLTRIDFRLLRPDNTWVDVNDALNFTPSGTDTRSAGFNYSLNLSGYGSGNYILQAIAYDKAGAASNVVSKNFIVQAPNQAPNSLQFGLNKTTFLNTETLSINNGWVFDGNGASTLSRVDFRLMQPNGTWIDISDATSFTPWTSNQNWGAFSYSLNLGSYAAGNYALSAIAYDKSGAISNTVSQNFTVQVPNQAPTSLQFGLNKTTFLNAETLTVNNGWVFDGNGASDLSRVDFRLMQPNGIWIDISDATSFTPAPNPNWGAFSYSLNLGSYAAGNYALSAIAYDKSGAISNTVSQNFTVQVPNQAPTSLQFGLNKTTFLNAETLTVNNGWVFDGNGASDLSRVDFRLMQPNGIWIDISDATSFTPAPNPNWGAFSYSLNLGSYAAGNYALSAIAYDKSGAISNTVSQSFVVQIPVINDWFSLNLKDKELIDLTRNLAKDGELSRTDMIAIFRNAEDGNIIDATEVIDLRLVLSDRGYMMPDYVKNLTGKIVNSDPANAPSGIGNLKAGSSSTHMENLIGKWFLGNDRPDAISYNRTTTHTYQSVSGSLFQGGISYIDVDQNDVGDCYYLAALGSVARQSTSTIQNMFVSQNDDNGDGITDSWTVRLFNNGVADYVTVDRFLPTSVGGGAVFAGWGGGTFNNANNELWVALAEKAYAQFNESGWIGQDNTNSYNGTTTSPTAVIRNAAGINGGHPTTTLRQITGLNTSWFGLVNSVVDMISAFNAGKMVTLCTPDLTGSGIVNNHCYSLIGYNATTDQFRVYNPWGYNNDSQAERWISRQQLLDNFNEWAAIS